MDKILEPFVHDLKELEKVCAITVDPRLSKLIGLVDWN